MTQKRRELNEGMGSGAGGDSQTQADRRDGYGQLLGPPPEVRAPAAPLRNNPLISKRLVPTVNAVEHGCYGNACVVDVRESPRRDENVHGDSAAFSAPLAIGVLAMADSVPTIAEEPEVKTVTGDVAEARRVAAARRNAARVRDDPTLNQAMACIHRERWLEAMLDELHSISEHGVYELCELPAGCRPLPAKWVLKIKRGAQGEIERFKARYVAKGMFWLFQVLSSTSRVLPPPVPSLNKLRVHPLGQSCQLALWHSVLAATNWL